jgi:GNAT superfamily N-acetyltransferase
MHKPEINNGAYIVPPGKIAYVATRLDMKTKPERTLAPWPEDLQLVSTARGDLNAYRNLFRTVGEDLLWFSRLVMQDDTLRDTLANPATEAFTVTRGTQTIGILELSFRNMPDCELSFFGLVSSEIGKGTGRALIDEAIRRAFAKPITRFWLTTCTLDHPKALSFYRKAGFTPYVRQIEVYDDPRLDGSMPLTSAPHIPVLK